MSETVAAKVVCCWCGRGVIEGNAVYGAAESEPSAPAVLHVECASRRRLRRLAWRDSERMPIGEAVRILAEMCDRVEQGETITFGPESPLWARARLAVLQAKGERP